MAITKSSSSFQASATNTAGSTTTGSSVDLTGKYGCSVTLKVTNGGTGPTVGCDARIEVSNDNSDWWEVFRATAGVANSGVYIWMVDLPASILYARSVFGGNTAQSVTVEADGHVITAV